VVVVVDVLVVVEMVEVVVVVVDGGTQSRQQSVRPVATTPCFAVHLLADFWMLQPGKPSSSSSSAGAPGTMHTSAPFFPHRDFAAHSTTSSRHSFGMGRRFAFFATQLM